VQKVWRFGVVKNKFDFYTLTIKILLVILSIAGGALVYNIYLLVK